MEDYSRTKIKVRFLKGAAAALLLPAMLLVAAESFASPVEWVDWSSVTTGSSGSGTGTLNLNSGTVNVGLTGNVWGFSNGTTHYSGYPATFGNLNPSDLIQEFETGSVVITFDKPVTDLYIALLSVGQALPNQPAVPVTYTFTLNGNPVNASLVSSGPDEWGPLGPFSFTNGTNLLTGQEFSGVLRFSSPISQLTIGFGADELWHGFNLGAANPDNPVPEPATMLLFGTGIIGLGGFIRKRRKQ